MLAEHSTSKLVEHTHFDDPLTESPQEPAIDAPEGH